ncbi:hypothetical protein J6590_078629 [Homalodisca vitripennis]|nr:hypothetical protein J6590_078629 [Homalodisca vitripennis]
MVCPRVSRGVSSLVRGCCNPRPSSRRLHNVRSAESCLEGVPRPPLTLPPSTDKTSLAISQRPRIVQDLFTACWPNILTSRASLVADAGDNGPPTADCDIDVAPVLENTPVLTDDRTSRAIIGPVFTPSLDNRQSEICNMPPHECPRFVLHSAQTPATPLCTACLHGDGQCGRSGAARAVLHLGSVPYMWTQ